MTRAEASSAIKRVVSWALSGETRDELRIVAGSGAPWPATRNAHRIQKSVDVAADRFDFPRDILRGTSFGPLEQQFASELCDTVCLGCFGQHSSFEHCPELDEWQAMIFFDEQAQTI